MEVSYLLYTLRLHTMRAIAVIAIMAVAAAAFPTDFVSSVYYTDSACTTAATSGTMIAGTPLDYCYWVSAGSFAKYTYANSAFTYTTYTDSACSTGAGTPFVANSTAGTCINAGNGRYVKSTYPSSYSFWQISTFNTTASSSCAATATLSNQFVARDVCTSFVQSGVTLYVKTSGALNGCTYTDGTCATQLSSDSCGSFPNAQCSDGTEVWYNSASGVAPTTAVVAAAALIAAFVSKF